MRAPRGIRARSRGNHQAIASAVSWGRRVYPKSRNMEAKLRPARGKPRRVRTRRHVMIVPIQSSTLKDSGGPELSFILAGLIAYMGVGCKGNRGALFPSRRAVFAKASTFGAWAIGDGLCVLTRRILAMVLSALWE